MIKLHKLQFQINFSTETLILIPLNPTPAAFYRKQKEYPCITEKNNKLRRKIRNDFVSCFNYSTNYNPKNFKFFVEHF